MIQREHFESYGLGLAELHKGGMKVTTEEIVVKRCVKCGKKWFACENELIECDCGGKVV